MAATYSRKSNKPGLRLLSPSGTLRNSRLPLPSSTSTYPSRPTPFFHCSTSPSRVNLCGSVNTVAGSGQAAKRQSHRHQKRTCMCSPTTHPGSFRCSLHKNFGSHSAALARRSSLVRIRGVEGELVKRALAALIRPSSHHQRRRRDFRPRLSRLCAMSKAEEDSFISSSFCLTTAHGSMTVAADLNGLFL
ncbi:hypothetical protein RIF29_09474 [Crotalaria pallida]|uniref:Serine-rich protein-like protein n=1 Tax=Crotalaria pallida TaxID=3830 RepID=A0AAN9FRY3_CROPI